MFKGFQNTSRSNGFNGFPALNFQMNNQAYGFSGARLWMDASYGTNTQTDLSAISSWYDRIYGFQFIQTTAGNQPRYIASNANYNNFSVIDFYDVNRGLRLSPSTQRIPNISTVAFVSNYDSINTRNAVIGDTIGTSNLEFGLGGSVASPNITGPFMRTTVAETFGTTESTSVKICVFSKNLIMVNGLTESTTTNEIQFSIDSIGFITNSANSLNGKIAEIICYSNVFDSTMASSLSAKLNQKYAIY